MAPPKFKNKRVVKRNALLKKIDSALSLSGDCKVDDPTDNPTDSEIISFESMHMALDKIGRSKLMLQKFVSSDFLFHDKLYRSKVLADKKLYEAILYAKIFENELNFDTYRGLYQGQLVWVADKNDMCEVLRLISHNRIIYSLERYILEDIRRDFHKMWSYLRDKVEDNLIEALLLPDPTEESSECVSDLQSSSDTAVATDSAATDEYQVRYPMTDEVKKVMLDELSSFNLDPRIKQQFVFDLKVLPDKDVFYWRDRLDSLRLCSSYAAANSQESAELQKLSQLVEDLEKITRDSATWLASANRIPETMVLETVSQVQDVVNQPQMRTSPDTVSSLNDAAGDRVACLKTKAEEAKVTGENMEKLKENISSLAVSVSAIEKKVQHLGNSLASRNEEVGFLMRRVRGGSGSSDDSDYRDLYGLY